MGNQNNGEPYGLESAVDQDLIDKIKEQFGTDKASQDLIQEVFDAARNGKDTVDMESFLNAVNGNERVSDTNGAYFSSAIDRGLEDNISFGISMKLKEFTPLGVEKYGLDTVIGLENAGFIAGHFPNEADYDLVMEAFAATKAQCEADGKPVSFGTFLDEVNARVSDVDGARFADTIKQSLMEGNDYDSGVSFKLSEISSLGVPGLDIASLPKFDVAACATCDVGGLAPVASQGVAAADKGPQIC